MVNPHLWDLLRINSRTPLANLLVVERESLMNYINPKEEEPKEEQVKQRNEGDLLEDDKQKKEEEILNDAECK
jgi:hypothetical protein